jgi:hypothetical protein
MVGTIPRRWSWLNGLIRSGQRDLRIDFFRGLALWFICVNHSQLNLLRNLTLAKFTLADAAEVFVLLAGYAAGIVYGKALDRQGWPLASGTVVRRAGVVYISHVFMVVMFAALASEVSDTLSQNFTAMAKLDPLAEPGFEGVQQLLMLRFQPFNMDILPLYVVLLVILAVTLPLLRHPLALLGLSLAVYVAAYLLQLNFPAWPQGQWFFNPLTWQLLFLVGAALGYRPPGGDPRSVPLHMGLIVACIAFLLVSRPIHFLIPRADVLPDALAAAIHSIKPLFPSPEGKTWLHPLRLLSILSLAYLAGHWVRPGAGWLQGLVAAPFVLMGQHGLAVFCSTVPLSFISDVAIGQADGSYWPVQAGVNVAVLAVLLTVATLSAWLKPARASETGGRAIGRPTAPSS